MDGTGDLLAKLADTLSPLRPVQVVAYPSHKPLDYAALTTLAAQALPEGPCVVLGESFSGPIAIELAATRQKQIRTVILAATFVRSPLPAALAHLARYASPRWMPKKAKEALMLGKFGTPQLRMLLHSVTSKLPPDVLMQRAVDVLRVDKRDRLGAVACPILYLQGSADRIIRRKCLREIMAIQPATTVRTFNAPHMLLETHARDAAQAINAFCVAHGL
jgi:pimeloyl-ACP methyl ester carboxylesterase